MRGEVAFHLHCAPRLDYRRAETRAEAEEQGVVSRAVDGSGPTLRLVESVPLVAEAGPHEAWLYVVRPVDYVCRHWRDPDQGIWEMRGPRRHWLHSRLMCWVAVDRAARLALKRSLLAPLARWHEVQDEIHASIWDEFWDAGRGHFVAAAGGAQLDAAMLLMPLVRFVSVTDPQWLAALDAIGRELVEGSLVFSTSSRFSR